MNYNIKKMVAVSARAVLALVFLVCAFQTIEAQDQTKSFSVCALNVDGLPNKILGIDPNPCQRLVAHFAKTEANV